MATRHEGAATLLEVAATLPEVGVATLPEVAGRIEWRASCTPCRVVSTQRRNASAANSVGREPERRFACSSSSASPLSLPSSVGSVPDMDVCWKSL